MLGEDINTIWKNQLIIDYSLANNTVSILIGVLIANLVLIFLFCLFFALRFYHSLKPIVSGIEKLAEEENINLDEKGITSELALKLNQTSRILQSQKKFITRRDQARTNWIAGVSHDIRTPLAVIMGYTEQMEDAENLNEEQKTQISSMKNQSIRIKTLIEDLNLTSKLQYQMQPLRKEQYQPAKMMREIVTSYYNNGLNEKYEINLELDEKVESLQMTADTALLLRAYENVIGNAIRHNENGCEITIQMDIQKQSLKIIIEDNGCGIPQEIITCLNIKEKNEDEMDMTEKISNKDTVSRPHIMGLYVVKQIIASHNGTVEFHRLNEELEQKKGTVVTILLPVKSGL